MIELWARDSSNVRVARVNDYSGATIVERFNEGSEWSLTLPSGSLEADVLSTPGTRLEVSSRSDVGATSVVAVGTVNKVEATLGSDGETLSIGLIDDTTLLNDRLVSPQPGLSGPPYATDAYWDASHYASTVILSMIHYNMGPGAVVSRRHPLLTLGPDLSLGTAVYAHLRWTPMLEAAQQLAASGGVAFQVKDMVASVWVPQTVPVTFTPSRRNCSTIKRAMVAPSANHVIAAGEGEGVARLVLEGDSVASQLMWGRRIEEFYDRRSGGTNAELAQAIDGRLVEAQTTPTIEVEAIDIPGSQWGVDYRVGDRVSVFAGGEVVTTPVQQVTLTLGADGAQIKTTLAASMPRIGPKFFRKLDRLDSRVHNMEVR